MKKVLFVSLLFGACSIDENVGVTTGSHQVPSAVGSVRWAVGLGGSWDDQALSVAVDSTGDVIAIGLVTSDPVNFGSGRISFPRASLDAPFITKRASTTGAERWTRMLLTQTPGSNITIGDIAVTPDDDVIVGGHFVGTVDFGGLTLSNAATPNRVGGGYLARYAANGELRWVREIDGYVGYGFVTAVDSEGRIYVAGTTGTIVDHGTYEEIENNHLDAFVRAYTPDGIAAWTSVITTTQDLELSDLTIAPNGDLLVAGGFRGSIAFGGGPVPPAETEAVFLARYRFDGLHLSARAFRGTMPHSTRAAAKVRTHGSQEIVQYFEHTPSDPLGWSQFVAIDAAGTDAWTLTVPHHATYAPLERALVVTSSGLVVTSQIRRGAPGNPQNPTAPTGDIEVVTVDGQGDAGVAGVGAIAAQHARLHDGALAPDGAFVFAGEYSGTGNFGAAPIQTAGIYDSDVLLVVAEPAN